MSAEIKLNKDGLEGGKLVSEKDHLRIVTANRQAAAKKAKELSELAAKEKLREEAELAAKIKEDAAAKKAELAAEKAAK